jgi:small-conductance mechanosensitive channel
MAALPEAAEWKIDTAEATSGQYSGVIISVNGRFVMGILTDDLDRESGETLKAAADQATAQLRIALNARAQQRHWRVLFKSIGATIAATLIALLGLWLLARGGRRLRKLMARTASAQSQRIKLGGIDPEPALKSLVRGTVRLLFWGAAIALVYLWLTFVLLRFPYSQPWGEQLGRFLTNVFATLGTGFLQAMPGIFTVVVVFVLTRIAARVVGGIFRRVEDGDLNLPWLDPDTARATRRLVTVLIWILGLTVAYPYIPGSSTEAFKGISVFVGLMLSLGSAGMVNQVMSGLVVIYSRALRPGEFVCIGDDTGRVTEVGLLSTKILTRKREEIIIPNAVLVGTKTVNYSRHASKMGAGVGTTITIGYDAPWRQVHAMLLQAAAQTKGLREDPAPRVWQKALSDFYVEYELVVSLDQPEERVPVLSELHKHIQDAFNEQGVQIMSPHFENQPHNKVWVPKSQWFPQPAGRDSGESLDGGSNKHVDG